MASKVRPGEHPLVGKCRELHAELSLVYGVVWLVGPVLLVAQNYGGPHLAAWVRLLVLVACVAAGTLAISHFRWSR